MKYKLVVFIISSILFNYSYPISRFGLSKEGFMKRKYTGVIIDSADRVIIDAINSMNRQDILDNKKYLGSPTIKIKDAIYQLYHNLKYKSTTKTEYLLLKALENKNLKHIVETK